MRAVLQRVRSASVAIQEKKTGEIGRGFLVLLGIAPEDTEKECDFLLEKVLGLRVFEDEAGKMNRSLMDCGASFWWFLSSPFTQTAGRAAAPPLQGPPGRKRPCRCTKGFWPVPERQACAPNAGNSAQTCWFRWKTTAPSPSCWTPTTSCPGTGLGDKGEFLPC